MSVTALHRAYRGRVARLRASTELQAILAGRSDLETFVAETVSVVLDAQRQTVNLTDAYLSAEAGLATGTSTEPWGIDPERVIGAAARQGVALEEVYARNFRVNAGTFAGRMAREVNTDITLAARSTSWIHTEGDPRITGWQRVLGAGKHCGLCVAAATRRYGRGDLQPIHAHCGCSVAPIYGGTGEPDLSTEVWDRLYAQVGSTDPAQLGRVTVDDSLTQIEVVDSTLGPTLVAA